MCAMHAINGLLQRPATDRTTLHAVSTQLDDEERGLLTAPPEGKLDSNARPDGDYIIQVIQRALALMGGEWTLTETKNPAVRDRVQSKPQHEAGYLLNPGGALDCSTPF